MKVFFGLSKNFLFSTPLPSSISYFWNFGSLLGINLIVQIITGFFLTFHYQANIEFAFESVSISICENTDWGYLIRSAHANGATFFFFFIFIHVSRGIIFKSFFLKWTWCVGVLILLVLMGTAFLGYVLPWGQMSFWGATVITNLLSAIPYLGEDLVQWVWGGFSVSEPTLERFFSIHFILPFLIMTMVLFHILLLHKGGSSNPLGIDQNSDKVFFHPFYMYKDVLGIMTFMLLFLTTCILYSDKFMDPDNFSLANPLSTPPHIQPEWYFLFAYAILRSTPTKLGGVIALIFSICVLLLFPFKKKYFWSFQSSIFNKMLNSFFFCSFFFLTWLGSMPVEYPFEWISQTFSMMYFMSAFSIIFF